MEQDPSWEADYRLAVQSISCLLWNLYVYYRIQNIPPLFPILCQMNSVSTLTFYFFKEGIIVIF
jgi:hypothetical protein